jgi:hypothetical protein
VPRRWFDFRNTTQSQRHELWLLPALVGWGLLLLVLELTARVAAFHQTQMRTGTGPAPAFLLLGAWLCCFHFMYYDVLLTALPMALLFTEPRRYLEPLLVIVRSLPAEAVDEATLRYWRPRRMEEPPLSVGLKAAPRHLAVLNRMAPTVLVLLLVAVYLLPLWDLSSDQARVPPWETVCLMALWLWCGWLTMQPD